MQSSRKIFIQKKTYHYDKKEQETTKVYDKIEKNIFFSSKKKPHC
jgi:hypothetical protein